MRPLLGHASLPYLIGSPHHVPSATTGGGVIEDAFQRSHRGAIAQRRTDAAGPGRDHLRIVLTRGEKMSPCTATSVHQEPRPGLLGRSRRRPALQVSFTGRRLRMATISIADPEGVAERIHLRRRGLS